VVENEKLKYNVSVGNSLDLFS